MEQKKSQLADESGLGRLSLLLLLFVLGSVVFVSAQVFPFYYNYYEIQGLMEAQVAKGAEFSDEEIRRSLWERIQKLDIPLSEADEIKISRYNGKINIEFDYQEVLTLEIGEQLYDLYTFDFSPQAERTLAE